MSGETKSSSTAPAVVIPQLNPNQLNPTHLH